MSNAPWVGVSVLLAFAAGCGSGAGISNPQALLQNTFAPGEFRADGISTKEVLVKVKPGSTAVSPYALRVIDRVLARHGVYSIVIPPGKTAEQLIASLKSQPGILAVQPNYYYTLDKPVSIKRANDLQILPLLQIDDPLGAEQYQLTVTKAFEAWDVMPGKKNIRLALVDTGIDPDHPDLKSQLDPQVGLYNVFTKDNQVKDGHGHGTHTAGIAAAAANNKEGGAGMAPGVTLMAVQVLNAGGGGDSKSIAAGYYWASDNGANIISASLGIYQHDKTIEDALQYALDKDVCLVASAGNNGSENDQVNKPHLPSTYPGVIEVAASDKNDKRTSFSNYGKTVSVAAPGMDVLSTVPTYTNGTGKVGYAKMSGTSMAAPGAAGVVALIRSQHPDWKRDQVKAALEKAADDLGAAGFDPYYGNGRINALKSVN
ncbi:MAG: S8 family serine peptidase [Cyanobacteria bacterium NC_groundwater_1444_Ag_S-0.65um_54_12]|nr:S8 family serine peptidase [Cyanobacteria bacterium NC_groundwater_1444_Ag_S-0.65um_54_12]